MRYPQQRHDMGPRRRGKDKPPGTSQPLGWTDWNRCFEEWAAAELKVARLQEYACVIAAANPPLAAAARNLALLERSLADLARDRLPKLMIALLVCDTGRD